MRWGTVSRTDTRAGPPAKTSTMHVCVRVHVCVCTRVCALPARELPSPFPDDASLDPDKVCDPPPPPPRVSPPAAETKRMRGRISRRAMRGGGGMRRTNHPKIPSDPRPIRSRRISGATGLVNNFRWFCIAVRRSCLLSSLTRAVHGQPNRTLTGYDM